MNEGKDRIDYRETSDITEVHSAIRRESEDPTADSKQVPLWLTLACAVAVCWAGAYIGVFHGGFSGAVYNEYESSPAVLFPLPKKAGAEGESAGAAQSLAQIGKGVYSQCQPCHQANGAGVAGQFPPLVKSDYVVAGEKRLIAILLKGIQGPLVVEGKTYNGAMPAWEKALSDKKIAAVASYIRSEWGNSAPEISEAKVAAARKELEARSAPYTEADLQQIPADATLGEAAAPAGAPAASGAAPAVAKPAGAGLEEVMAKGKQQYMAICVACHQPTGLGLPPVFPPLAKTEYVNGDPKRFAAMVLKGVAGPITVDGKAYNNMMPGQEAVLTDEKIAAVLTYVRNSFGNQSAAVTPEVVAAARKEFAEKKTPWTEAELKAFGGAPAAQ
jgi:mono/diheme cytochrome c family protein